MANIRVVIRIVMLVFGFYEFFLAYQVLTADATKLAEIKLKLFMFPPAFLTQVHTRYLSCMFTTFLGLNRLSWATGNGGIGPWLCLVTTHFTELLFLWTLAFTGQHFNTQGDDLITLAKKVINFEIGTKEGCIVLCIVPLLLFLSLVHGPKKFESFLDAKRKIH